MCMQVHYYVASRGGLDHFKENAAARGKSNETEPSLGLSSHPVFGHHRLVNSVQWLADSDDVAAFLVPPTFFLPLAWVRNDCKGRAAFAQSCPNLTVLFHWFPWDILGAFGIHVCEGKPMYSREWKEIKHNQILVMAYLDVFISLIGLYNFSPL